MPNGGNAVLAITVQSTDFKKSLRSFPMRRTEARRLVLQIVSAVAFIVPTGLLVRCTAHTDPIQDLSLRDLD